jgi:chromosome segregation ATPase
MGLSELGPDKQKKYDELKKKYSEKSRSEIPEKQTDVKSFSDIINSLQNQIVQKQSTLEGVKSQDILADLSQKKVRLENNVISKKQHIQELKSNLQTLQKEIIHTIKEIRDETDIKINELSTTNNQLSQLTTEENELVEKIHHNQKLRVSQEKELEELRLERLNIVNKNKDTQKIQVQILQYRSRLDQITSDRAMLELEIKSQMNLLEEERQKERDIITKIIKQNKS